MFMRDPTPNYFLGQIKKSPLVYVDVGAMGGIARKWAQFGPRIQIIAFEPDDREFQKLSSTSNTRFLNCVLYDRQEEVVFYVSRESGKSSIFKPNLRYLSQFPNVDRFQVVEQVHFPSSRVRTFDALVEEGLLGEIDFIKLDTEGTELAILKGGKNRVLPKTFGFQLEVEFIRKCEGQPLFRDIDSFLDENGFQLIDLRRQYWKRADFNAFPGKGQLVFGDALYFKTLDALEREVVLMKNQDEAKEKIYKAILICLVYRCLDYAAAVADLGKRKNILSEVDHVQAMEYLRRYATRDFHFPGKGFVYKVAKKLVERLKPKSYLGFSDSDNTIANVQDI